MRVGLLLWVFFLAGYELIAQPGRIVISGKIFYVYPLRSDAMAVPAYFGNLPDGEYVMYSEYAFKQRKLSHSYKLLDSTVVAACFHVKNNLPNGNAAFYRNGSVVARGAMENGMRQGIWEFSSLRDVHEFILGNYLVDPDSCTLSYTTGILDGPAEYYFNIRWKNHDTTLHLASGMYKLGYPVGEWKFYKGNEILCLITYSDSLQHKPTVYDKMFPSVHMDSVERIKQIQSLNRAYSNNISIENGSVVYFDTLYSTQYRHSYVLQKLEPEKPDSLALFRLNGYSHFSSISYNSRPDYSWEYIGGKLLSQTGDPGDYAGTEKGTTRHYKTRYGPLRPGQLYCSEEFHDDQNDIYYYQLDSYVNEDPYGYIGSEFQTKINRGDTVSQFKTLGYDSVKESFKYVWIKYNSFTHLTTYSYMHTRFFDSWVVNDDSTSVIDLETDSTRLYWQGKPFTGRINYDSKYFGKEKMRLRAIDTLPEIYIRTKRSFSFGEYDKDYYILDYTNGRKSGKQIKGTYGKNYKSQSGWNYNNPRGEKENRYKKTEETFIPADSTRPAEQYAYTYKYKLNRKERKIARKNGIKKRRVSYISYRLLYENKSSTSGFTHEYWYPTGHLESRNHYENNKLNGVQLSWYSDGTLSDSAFYVNGIPAGTSLCWFRNGRLKTEDIRNYQDTLISSRSWYKNGRLKSKTVTYNTSSGNLVLLDTTWFKNGQCKTARFRSIPDAYHTAKQWTKKGVLISSGKWNENGLHGDYIQNKNNGDPGFFIHAVNGMLTDSAVLYNSVGTREWKLNFDPADSCRYNQDFTHKISNDLRERKYIFTWDNPEIVKAALDFKDSIAVSFYYTEFYPTGSVAAQGRVKHNKLTGTWKFYSPDGNLVHVLEADKPFTDTLKTLGEITSYYTNGKIKSVGYLLDYTRDYDCSSGKNIYSFDIMYRNYWEPDSNQTLINGNGTFTDYDEHGRKQASGTYSDFKKTGIWKTWDKENRLSSIGQYENDKKQGPWWTGDLQGLNFVDNMCFEEQTKEVENIIKRSQKELQITQYFYKDGREEWSKPFKINMNTKR